MRQREYKPSTRVGYRNRPRTLPARTIIREWLEKEPPDYDHEFECCYDCYYGPSPRFSVGDSVAFPIPGRDADVLKPGPGWATGEVIAVNKNNLGYTESYTVYTDRPIEGYRPCAVIVDFHRLIEIPLLDRLAGIA